MVSVRGRHSLRPVRVGAALVVAAAAALFTQGCLGTGRGRLRVTAFELAEDLRERAAAPRDAASARELLSLAARAEHLRYLAEDGVLAGTRRVEWRRELASLQADREKYSSGGKILPDRRGVVLLGYISDTDGSLQPLSVSVPERYHGQAMSLIVWLHGHGWFKPFQGHPAPEYTGAICVSPTGRGATDYMELGEEDVLRAIDTVRALYHIDDRRIYLAGRSMGGTGCWNMAVRYPHRFAGIVPVAGNSDNRVWSSMWEWNQPRPWHFRELREFLHAARSPVTYAENLRHVRAFCIHGTADDVVPVGHARSMVERLRALGYPVEYREYPDTGHRRIPPEDVRQGLAHVAAHARPGAVRDFSYRTDSLRHGAFYWGELLLLREPLKFATIEGKRQDDGSKMIINTDNVLAFRLDPGSIPAPGNVDRIVLDGQIVECSLAGSDVFLVRDEGRGLWAVSPSPPDLSGRKRRGVEGPVEDVFRDRFVLVYGTADPGWQRATKEEAERFASEWERRYGGACQVVADSELKEDLAKESNLVLFGGPRANRQGARLVPRSPVTIGDGGVRIGTETFSGGDVGTIFCCPNPEAPDRMMAVFASMKPDGLYHVTGRFGRWFNWGVLDNRRWFDYAVYDARTIGPESFLRVGLFSGRWQLAPGTSWSASKEARNLLRPASVPSADWPGAGETVSLSRVRPAEIDQMRGGAEFDRSFRGGPIVVGGTAYERGIGVRCPSAITWKLPDGRRYRLEAAAGLVREWDEDVSKVRERTEAVRFVVEADGKRLFVSKDVTWESPSVELNVNLGRARTVTLRVERAGGALWLHGTSAWANPRLVP